MRVMRMCRPVCLFLHARDPVQDAKARLPGPAPLLPRSPARPPQTSSASQLAGALAGCLQDACGCRELTVLALGRQGSCCSAQPSGRLNASACAKSKQIDEQNLSCAHLSLVALPPVRDDCSRRTAARLLHANLRGPTFPLKGATLPAGMRGTPIDVIPLNCLCGWCTLMETDGQGGVGDARPSMPCKLPALAGESGCCRAWQQRRLGCAGHGLISHWHRPRCCGAVPVSLLRIGASARASGPCGAAVVPSW